MDKNSVNIDDLVRQRLSGGEEPISDGSWERMRMLLDEKMPERRGLPFTWGRTLGVIAALALVSVATVGGYNWLRTAGNSSLVDVRTSVKAGSDTQPAAQSSSHYSVEPKQGAHSSVTSIRPSSHSQSIPSSAKNIATGSISRFASHQSAKVVARAGKVSELIEPTSAVRPKDKVSPLERPVVSALKLSIDEKTVQAIGQPLPTPLTTLDILTEGGPATEMMVDNKDGKMIPERHIAESKTAPHNKQQITAPSQKQGERDDEEKVVASASNEKVLNQDKKIKENSVPKNPKPEEKAIAVRNDTVKSVSLLQRYVVNPATRKAELQLDTLTSGTLILARAADPISEAGSPESAVSASSGGLAKLGNEAVTSAEVHLVPLSDYKVASRKTTQWNTRTFDEVVRDVKFNLSKVRFYPGISAGINSYVFGPANLGGIQLGFFGLVTFGESWSAMGELKYVHRFNNGSEVTDNYIDIKKNGGPSYLQSQVRHFFKFSSLQSIEMPLALRFAAGRLNLFAGANLSYHFAVNAEETSVYAPDTSYVAVQQPVWASSKPTISYDDFHARFALGGLAGISWALSPALQLDFRVSKSFWDNGRGAGAEKVSEQLYRAPAMQMSIFYRFNQKNQIPRAK